jgi:Right handed beta helix region
MTPLASRHWRTALTAATATVAAALALTACSGSPSSSVTAATASPNQAGSQPAATSPAGTTPASSTPGGTASGGTSAGCGSATGTTVSSASGLRAALKAAVPGSTIVLSAGVYSGHFEGTASGTSADPITLCGPRSAVLDGGAVKSGYTFHLQDADWWRVEGFSIEGGQKGVVTDTSDHVLIDGLYVHDIGDEAIHLRDFSSYDTVSDNVIRDTGQATSFYGEGIYVGSANKNWCRYSGCKPDGSNYDIITGNNIADTTAENIDIKEGTVGGLVSGNHFDGTGMNPSSATSWVNVKGNDWKITDNTGIDSVENGLSDHQVYPGWGLDNTFTDNSLSVDGPGYGVFVQNHRLGVTVACDNQVTGAQKGLSNLDCSSA